MNLSGAFAVVLFLLLVAWTTLQTRATTTLVSNSTPEVPLTATRHPEDFTLGHSPGSRLPLPTASASEREDASNTWLYLAAFQSMSVSVIDPHSGHTLHEIPTVDDRAGVAISPAGDRLYMIDDLSLNAGKLRVLDTKTWRVIHQEPVANLARMFINPIILSGDGSWLLVHHYDDRRDHAWDSVFDTRQLRFLPDGTSELPDCSIDVLQVGLTGSPGHPRLYSVCNNILTSIDSDTLEPLWHTPAPTSHRPSLVLGPAGKHLYGLFPQITTVLASNGHYRVSETELRLLAWSAETGQLEQEVKLRRQVTVPPATIGRGDAGYLTRSPDGTRLYVAWEDRLWAVMTEKLQVVDELALPAAVDGMGLSRDGRELYLLPAWSGDLRVQGHGLWTVDSIGLKLTRQTVDWPDEANLFAAELVAAPAPLCEHTDSYIFR
jgi:hypothetical protein